MSKLDTIFTKVNKSLVTCIIIGRSVLEFFGLYWLVAKYASNISLDFDFYKEKEDEVEVISYKLGQIIDVNIYVRDDGKPDTFFVNVNASVWGGGFTMKINDKNRSTLTRLNSLLFLK